MKSALSQIGADGIEGCCFYKYESTITQLSDAFGFLEDIDQLNELANIMKGFTKEQAYTYQTLFILFLSMKKSPSQMKKNWGWNQHNNQRADTS